MTRTNKGVRLRRLREERGLSQAALAQLLGLSPSYLNQIEQNQRPLTVKVLLKLNETFGLDEQLFGEADEARVVAELRDALAHGGVSSGISLAELREIASSMPAVARAVIQMDARHREALNQLEAMTARVGGERGGGDDGAPSPYDEVRDFLNARENYIAELDEAAERAAAEWTVEPGRADEALKRRLETRHGVQVALVHGGDAPLRVYDRSARILRIASRVSAGRRAFQMAMQLAFLENGDVMEQLIAAANLSGAEARSLARIGLANYYAGAVLLPYGGFLQAAEELRYDIDRLGREFDVGFETVCHRLSTLQRPRARGIPFFFMRVDRAGNISKRQSATHFHFSKVGGTCPLWNVYEAFSQPGRILTQLARMPDGRAYLWVARTVSGGAQGFGLPERTYAVALGCDVQHAPRLVYSKGLDLHDPSAPTPIGMGCKVCERTACPQRAFPAVGRPLDINENRRPLTPYEVAR